MTPDPIVWLAVLGVACIIGIAALCRKVKHE